MIKKAIVEYEKAVDLSGSTPLVLAALATVYYEYGKKTKAEKLFDRS